VTANGAGGSQLNPGVGRTMIMAGDEPIEIWFPVPQDDHGYPSSQPWEQLHAYPTPRGYRVDNVPFFTKDVAVGDVVAAERTRDGWYSFQSVLERSGHSVFRIWLSEASISRTAEFVDELRRLGCLVETTLERLVAIDASPEVEARVWEHLERGQTAGLWDLSVGYSPD